MIFIISGIVLTFLILGFLLIAYLKKPHYIVRENELYRPDGKKVVGYDGNNPSNFPKWSPYVSNPSNPANRP